MQLLISSQSNTPAELNLYQPQEIVIIQVCGEKVSRKQTKKGHQQREANHEGSEKEEEVSRVLSGFSLTLRPRKIQTLFFPIFV